MGRGVRLVRYDKNGGVPGTWRYDETCSIVIVRRSDGIECFIPVCSSARRRFGAYVIERANATTWTVLPRKAVGEALVLRDVSLPTGGSGLSLLDAPEHVVSAFVALSSAVPTT